MEDLTGKQEVKTLVLWKVINDYEDKAMKAYVTLAMLRLGMWINHEMLNKDKKKLK